MSDTRKIAISLPGGLFDKMEDVRKRTGLSRSSFIRRAIDLALAEGKRRALIDKYRDGYLKYPETPEEVAGALISAAELLAREPWEE